MNSKIEKIKEIPNAFSIELFSKGKKLYLIVSRKTIFVSDLNYDGIEPSNFCQVLRKRLTNQHILNILQHEFDRIVEIETEDYILILELFRTGNIILVDKPSKKIIRAIEMRAWKDRSIKPNIKYEYPPSFTNPFTLTLKKLSSYFGDKEIVKVLAKDFGFGGEIAEKICEKLKIDKKSFELKNPEILYNFLKNIFEQFTEMKNVNSIIREEFENELENLRAKEISEIEEKTKKIIEKRKRILEELEAKKVLYEKYIEKINNEFIKFQQELEKQRELPQKEVIIESIPLHPRKTLNENIQYFYEEIKKMKRKIEKLKKKFHEVRAEEKKEIEKLRKERVKKEWYHKFHWFISSDGFLVVGGKDATTNELLIRKYMKQNDLVFHTDITGSPFVLIKNIKNEEIPQQTIKESAEFCASYSKAWKIGISAADVYYINPDQVKKEGGLPKGSFMIYGKRNWIRRVELKLAIGIVDDEIIYGPEPMVKRKTNNFIVIRPGGENIDPIFEKKFGKLKEEAKRAIPYGKCSIQKQ